MHNSEPENLFQQATHGLWSSAGLQIPIHESRPVLSAGDLDE